MTSKQELTLLRHQIERAKSLGSQYLECRTGGTRHRWNRVQPLYTFDVGLTRAFQCDNCLMLKHTAVSPKYGEQLIAPQYRAPAGYNLRRPDNGERIISPAAVRAALETMVDFDHLPSAFLPDAE